MASVRLYARQIARFAPGTGRRVIECALRRYRDGELIVVRSEAKRNKTSENVLQPFPLRHRADVPDALLRDILDAHFNTPRPELDRSIEALDREIAQMMSELPAYIIEDEDGDEDEEEEEDMEENDEDYD